MRDRATPIRCEFEQSQWVEGGGGCHEEDGWVGFVDKNAERVFLLHLCDSSSAWFRCCLAALSAALASLHFCSIFFMPTCQWPFVRLEIFFCPLLEWCAGVFAVNLTDCHSRAFRYKCFRLCWGSLSHLGCWIQGLTTFLAFCFEF